MRFKEFFTEDTQADLQPGYSLFTIPNGETIQIPTNIRQKYNDQQILAMLKQKGYPMPGQGAMVAKPQPQPQQVDTLPPGYREFKLPNGNLTAVPQQLDDKQALALIQKKRPDLLGPVAQSMTPKKPVRVTIPADLPVLPTVDQKLIASAKKTADTYLGRAMTPQEWDHLLRATYAESGHQPKEDAHIMGTILNRSRQGGFGGANISNVLTSPNQFQSVTGKKGERSMATNFTQGPPTSQSLTLLLQDVVKNLPKVPKDIGYFVSNKEAAFTKGTNKAFAQKLKQSGGQVIGQSVFNRMTPTGQVAPPTTLAKK